MKTNVSIELTDEQRDYLANIIDDKSTKRLATRGDIKQLVEQFIGATLAQAEHSGGKAETPENVANYNPNNDLYQIDREDRKFLQGKDPSYVRGWNQIKRGAK